MYQTLKHFMFIVALNIPVDEQPCLICKHHSPRMFKYIENIEQGKRGISCYFPLLLKSIINRIKGL
jgi:hypothetical protein